MRYHESMGISEKLRSKLPSLKVFSKGELDALASSTKTAITGYLNYFYLDDDSDYPVFDDYFWSKLVSQQDKSI